MQSHIVEVFRERDFTRVDLLRQVLESHGIKCMVRNEGLATSGLTEIPIPEFFPNLCVFREDAEEALKILTHYIEQEHRQSLGSDWKCEKCTETNPSSFDLCWQCSEPK